MSNIWRKKPIGAYEADMKKSELKRVLGKWSLTAIGVGAIIGGGIFVLTGTGAYYHAGPALALSFVIAGIACIFAALCYAELPHYFLWKALRMPTLMVPLVKFSHGLSAGDLY